MRKAFPNIGDFIVLGNPDGYVIQRVAAGNDREHVLTEKRRLAALHRTRLRPCRKDACMDVRVGQPVPRN